MKQMTPLYYLPLMLTSQILITKKSFLKTNISCILIMSLNRILSVFTGHMNCIGKKSKLNAPFAGCIQFITRCIQFAFLSDAIHMVREHRQNAIQYLYLYLFTTKFVPILLILTQKCHISQISNVQKVRHLEQR